MTHGDNREIRNLGYIKWKNDLSWMESQSGSKWTSLIENENKNFNNILSKVKVKKPQSEPRTIIDFHGWTIDQLDFSPEQIWIHKASGFKCKCWDADLSSKIFAATIQDSDGYERFTVKIFELNGQSKPTLLKTILNTGPDIAVVNRDVYYLGSEKDLRYSSLRLWNSEEEILYELNDLTENLEIKRGEDGSVYLIKGDFIQKKYGLLPSLESWSDEPHLNSCIVSSTLKLPGIEDTIESFSFKAGWIITRSYGIRTLLKIEKNSIKSITTIWGDISYDSRDPYKLYISDIRYDPYTIYLPEWKLTNPKPSPFASSYHRYPLPAFIVHPIGEVKGLLITAYGAYGIPTHVGSLISKWEQLLLEGWIVASVLVPGSGDHDSKWVESGQHHNRIYSLNMFKESIEAIQEEYSINPRKTALYGRSAGGLLVSSVALMNPGLVGALYIESPYLDILRTISNPSLPLTTLETTEFGTGNNPVNLMTTAAWSPMEHIPVEGVPDLFILARIDTNDLQVYPYEVLKFIKRIRGKGHGFKKLVYIHNGLGHFTTSWKTRAEDIGLLDFWLKSSDLRKKNIDYKYNMLASRKNHNRKNHTRKNRKQGGAKRSAARKGRKGTRRH